MSRFRMYMYIYCIFLLRCTWLVQKLAVCSISEVWTFLTPHYFCPEYEQTLNIIYTCTCTCHLIHVHVPTCRYNNTCMFIYYTHQYMYRVSFRGWRGMAGAHSPSLELLDYHMGYSLAIPYSEKPKFCHPLSQCLNETWCTCTCMYVHVFSLAQILSKRCLMDSNLVTAPNHPPSLRQSHD